MSNVKEIIKRLFEEGHYDRKIRPVQDYDEAVHLDVSFFLFSINHLNEAEEKLVTTAYLELVWTDENLHWDPGDHEGIEHFYIPQKEIWTPDIVLKNGFSRFEELGGSFYYLDVDFNGQITWLPYEVFKSQCPIDITFFPFDEQICHISFVIWSYARSEVVISGSNHGIKFYQYEENSIWSIVNTKVTIIDNPKIRESEITFTLHLKRKPLYIVMNVIIPIFFLAVVNILTFIIPADSGEKITFSMTVFLSFLVFLNVISADLPNNSESIPLLGVYLEIQLGYSIIVLIVTSLQLRIHYRSEEEKLSRLHGIIIRISHLMNCKRRSRTYPDNRDNHLKMEPNPCGEKRTSMHLECFADTIDQHSLKIPTEMNACSHRADDMVTNKTKPTPSLTSYPAENVESMYTWKDVSSALDVISFWVFIGSNCVLTIVFFGRMLVQ
ncbi:neuronal acetylcholine receptor subunit alpha-6-like [Ostrea edulis]|uniref:neuronal acetylcholine receptor subunit alpha-6-like n=1 Tax=Ostrea edulis TaxID=37623 RepID=UPI0024AEFEFE|nr:neuronal acetylcholine receptor subunit alpha-6-like [Ostrea edulis]